MPWSTVSTAQMRNNPFSAASTTSARSIRCLTLALGMRTPCSPFRRRPLHTSKKPWIFSLTPPMACIRPFWSTEPVTASDCLSGMPARAESSA